MDELFKIITPNSLVNAIGILLLAFVVIFKESLNRIFFKWWNRNHDVEPFVERRRRDNGIDANKVLEIMEKSSEATTRFTVATERLAEEIDKFSANSDRARDRIMKQNNTILAEIDNLDVPRRHRGRVSG